MKFKFFITTFLLLGCDKKPPEARQFYSESGILVQLDEGVPETLNKETFEEAQDLILSEAIRTLPWNYNLNLFNSFTYLKIRVVSTDFVEQPGTGIPAGGYTDCFIGEIVTISGNGDWIIDTALPHEYIHIAQNCIDDNPKPVISQKPKQHRNWCDVGAWIMLDNLRGTEQFLNYCKQE